MRKISDILELFPDEKSQDRTKLESVLKDIKERNVLFRQRESKIKSYARLVGPTVTGYAINEIKFNSRDDLPQYRVTTDGLLKIMGTQGAVQIGNLLLAPNCTTVDFTNLYSQIQESASRGVRLAEILPLLSRYRDRLVSHNVTLNLMDILIVLLQLVVAFGIYTYRDIGIPKGIGTFEVPMICLGCCYGVVAAIECQLQLCRQNDLFSPPSCPELAGIRPTASVASNPSNTTGQSSEQSPLVRRQ